MVPWWQDYRFLFDGVGGAALVFVLGLILRVWWKRRRHASDTGSTVARGNRSVAIGGGVTNATIVTGDQRDRDDKPSTQGPDA